MPHVIVKMYPGRTEDQKKRLTEAIVRDVTTILKCGEESVSVGIEDIAPADWDAQVRKPDIERDPSKIYKKPG